MRYENQTVVFPMGMKLQAAEKELHHSINGSTFKIKNRRHTLKMGNAIRMKDLREDTVFENCTIYLEGTLTHQGIVPLSVHKCFVWGTEEDGMPVRIGELSNYKGFSKGGNKYA